MSKLLDLFKLDGKVAIVTGAGRGIGQGYALALAEAGADVALVDVIPMDETAAKVAALDRKSVSITADLSKGDEAAPGIVAEVVQKLGRVDILVNNAGIIRREPFTEHSAKNWNDVIAINLSTPFFLSQAVAKQMVAQGQGGKIINIASMLSFQGGILVPGYAASKGGIKSLTMLMANELAPHKICANAIAPGYIATENTRPIRENPERNKAILDRIPAGRWGTPEDLMTTVVFLASPASDYINGHTLAVDGGWLSR
ncbi:2-deoxy-D-gluconate 3-dehydrogenase [Ereboglobus sp. PH5-10]|uniref:2-dehydro-3-deoxy-D-gluconate 5-dehydrogenase KduD n=1 Tax=Ereboglobus sp. PH5-10 TaxID=2940629 RepID=UPI0024072F2E|nr:2-dehydro-3-deoxy-D-gluconate 5-dehydrogenase KduD [Ereboglobus sp. PH5-10]MDF9828322.1 2-deoxy-D-gluconate 3-dehydrogenase [Ereboglobus sp. PH5-10]